MIFGNPTANKNINITFLINDIKVSIFTFGFIVIYFTQDEGMIRPGVVPSSMVTFCTY
jgi:hypothetical protein